MFRVLLVALLKTLGSLFLMGLGVVVGNSNGDFGFIVIPYPRVIGVILIVLGLMLMLFAVKKHLR